MVLGGDPLGEPYCTVLPFFLGVQGFARDPKRLYHTHRSHIWRGTAKMVYGDILYMWMGGGILCFEEYTFFTLG
jgi:hypothetical protein